MKNINKLLASLCMASSMVLTACGPGLTANNISEEEQLWNGESQPGEDTQVKEAYNKAVFTAQDVEAQVQTGQFDFNGLVNTDLLDSLKEKFKTGLDPVLDKFTEVKDRINGLKAKIQQQIDLLDPNNPSEARMIEELTRAIEKLDRATAKIDEVINKVVEKIDKLSAKLDDLINKIETGNILGVIIKMKIRELKNQNLNSMKDSLLILLMS